MGVWTTNNQLRRTLERLDAKQFIAADPDVSAPLPTPQEPSPQGLTR